MPQYLSPGVYVEEVPSSAAPIAGVSTSIAAFIGQGADNVTMPFRPGRPLDPANIVPADRYTVGNRRGAATYYQLGAVQKHLRRLPGR
jgi:phage tail sheath protein FI